MAMLGNCLSTINIRNLTWKIVFSLFHPHYLPALKPNLRLAEKHFRSQTVCMYNLERLLSEKINMVIVRGEVVAGVCGFKTRVESHVENCI